MNIRTIAGIMAMLVTFVATGCGTAHDKEARKPLVVSYVDQPEQVASAPSGKTDFGNMFADDILVGTRPAGPLRSTTKTCDGCPIAITGKSGLKEPAMLTPASSPATTSAVVPALIPPAPANPLHALKRGSVIGSLDGHGFGYNLDQLVYNPWWSPTKSVAMGEQKFPLTIPCEKHLLQDTSNFVSVELVVVVKPSLLWEIDYHRRVAEYSRGDNIVDAADVIVGATNYVAQHGEYLCALAHTKSLDELTRDLNLGVAGALNDWFRRDQTAPFEVLVHTSRVVLPEDLKQYLQRKGVASLKQPCCSCATPAPAPRPAMPKHCPK